MLILTEEDKAVQNARAQHLRLLTGMPIMECKKAAYMYSEDKDAVEYLQSHDWKIGKCITPSRSKYISDYPKKKISRGNPYYCCAECGVSDPQINGEIKNHQPWCTWRLTQE